jgi:hypothetical protein
LIVALPRGRTFNAEYYRDNILAALIQLQPEHDGSKLVVRADNARAHIAQKCRTFCKENGLLFAPHPLYLPDLAPSDFFLFGYVKERVTGMMFPSYEELLDAIGKMMTDIESETLTAVSEHWMERLEWVSKNNSDYYPETADGFIYFSPMSIRNRVAKPEWDTLDFELAAATDFSPAQGHVSRCHQLLHDSPALSGRQSSTARGSQLERATIQPDLPLPEDLPGPAKGRPISELVMSFDWMVDKGPLGRGALATV